ncbi:MAG: carbamoyltransferase HypF, partial [Lachnospiraceae bacterium]
MERETPKQKICGRLYRVYGIVQGVGFRPFVKRAADALSLSGSVCNRGPFVEIRAFGSAQSLDLLKERILTSPPERAVVLKFDEAPLAEPAPMGPFVIRESSQISGEIFVSPDIAICPACERELFDRNNRRYLHPFINCTSCGPRVTILEGMPYDRERTSMRAFPMCPACRYEYTHPSTRRYDAQPVCCNDCGPRVYLLHPGEAYSLPVRVEDLPTSETDHAAITAARRCIREGGIVAVKGIGGFHLCCDASNEKTVSLLRVRKHRPQKPFAVMMRDLDAVRRECMVGREEETVLSGHQKPIVLLPKQKSGTRLAPSIAPGQDTVGVMLPYAPLQLLLFRYDDGIEIPDALVMTSANASGAPICRDDKTALSELSNLCDLILSHNREIRLRCDDSVMTFFEHSPYMIRRSRGYAPLPFVVGHPFSGCVLAVGGELKNTFCIAKGSLLYPSPYVGDMGDIRSVQALSESVADLSHLLEAKPEAAACDLHPGYQTSAYARQLGLPLVPVQHHYAHVLSCLAENDALDETVYGVSFDGTGYGTDGTVWGGEI